MDEILTEPYVLEYGYKRSCGPIVGRFLAALRDGRFEGARTASGRVIVPPTEYDPDTGEAIRELVPVASTGTVVSWCWVAAPRATHPLQRPFAWALVKLDGADTAMLHAVDAIDPARMKTGLRVKARFASERAGHIRDFVFEVLA